MKDYFHFPEMDEGHVDALINAMLTIDLNDSSFKGDSNEPLAVD